MVDTPIFRPRSASSASDRFAIYRRVGVSVEDHAQFGVARQEATCRRLVQQLRRRDLREGR
jgi:hypothetical protein